MASKIIKDRQWSVQTFYLPKEFIEKYWERFLKLINKDPKLTILRAESKGKKNYISAVIRRLIEKYIEKAEIRIDNLIKQNDTNKDDSAEESISPSSSSPEIHTG